MSSIDERIVKMTFDNDKFQAGVQKTLETLDKLKEKLAFKDYEKSFRGLEVSANDVRFDGIASGVESLQKRFSTLGIIGMEVTKRITNAAIDAGKRINDAVFGQIKSGGMRRALNIEQAEFQLEGFGFNVKEIMKNANEAVSGTAYGLDEAARAASVLAASGVKAGDQMTGVLKSIAGAAAMTGRDFGDVADIYSTVASNGRLMTEQLRQFSHSGLNVTAVLQEAYHATGEEVQEMVKKGQISFNDFSKAMEKFGEHAQKANNTYNGALSNMKAALSRIGQLFATPYLKNARDIFNALTPVIDKIKKALIPFAETFEKTFGRITKSITDALWYLSGGNYHIGTAARIFQSLANILMLVGKALSTVKDAFVEVFPNATLKNLFRVVLGFRDYTKTLELSETQSNHIKYVFKGIFSVLKLVAGVIKTVISGIQRIFKPLGGLINTVITILGLIGRVVYGVATVIGKIKLFQRVFTIVTYIISGAIQVIVWIVKGIAWVVSGIIKLVSAIKNSKPVVKVIDTIKNAFKTCVGFITEFINKIKEIAKGVASWLGGATLKVIQKLVSWITSGLKIAGKVAEKFVGVAGKGLSKMVEKAKQLFNTIKNSKYVTSAMKAISKAIETARDFLGKFVDKVKEFIKSAAEWIKTHHVVQVFFDALKTGLQIAIGALIVAGQKIKDFAKKAYDFLKEKGIIETFTKAFKKGFDKVKSVLGKVVDKIKEFSEHIGTNLKDKMDQTGESAKKLHRNIKKSFIFEGIKSGMKTFEDAVKTLSGWIGILSGGLKTFFNNYLKGPLDQVLKVVSDKIKEFIGLFEGLKVKDILHYFPLEAFGVFLLSLAGFVRQSKKSVKAVHGVIDSVGGFFDTLSAKLKGELDGKSKWRKRAETLIIFAGAMYIFAVAIQKLGQMKPGDLAKGLIGVAVAIGLMTASLVILAKVIDKAILANPQQIGIGMLAMAGGVLILSFAVSQFAKMDVKELLKGFAGVIMALGVLTATVRLGLGQAKNMISTSIGLTILSVALIALAGAIKLYSKFNWEKTFGPGILAIGTFLIILAGAVRIMGKASHMTSTAVGILLIAASLFVFKAAIDKLAAVETDKLKKGMTAIVVLLAALAGSIFLIGKTGDLAGTSKAIISLTASLVVITVILKVLSSIDTANLIVGFVGLAGMLIAMAGALKMLDSVKNLGASVASLLALSLAISAIGLVVKQLASQPLANIAVALGGLVVMIIAMAGALKLLSGGTGAGGGSAIAAAGAMAIMSGSIILLSGALLVLSAIPVKTLAISVGLLAATLLVLAGVGALAGFPLVSAGLMALSVALLAIGATVLITSVGVMTFTAAITQLAELGPEAMQRVVDGITEFMTSLAEAAPQITVSAVIIATSFIAGLLSLVPAIAGVGIAMIISLMAGIASNIQTIVVLAGNIIVQFIIGLAKMIPMIINAGMLLMVSFILGLANGIRNNSALLFDAVKSLMESILEMVLNAFQTLVEGIPVVGDKISKGLESVKGKMRDAFDVDETNATYKESLDKLDSDTKASTENIKASTKGYGEGAKEGLKEGLSGLGDIGDEGMNDLMSSLQNGSVSLSELSPEMAAILPEEMRAQYADMGIIGADAVNDQAKGISSGKGKTKNAAKGVTNAAASEANKGAAKFGKAGKKANDTYNKSLSSGKKSSGAKSVVDSTVKALDAGKEKAKKAGTALVKAFSGAISKASDTAKKAGSSVAKSGASGTANSDAKDSATTAGKNLGNGLVLGLQAKEDAAYRAGYKLGQKAAQGQKDGAKEKSPSKIAIQTGKYLGEGLVIGINSMTKSAYNAGYNMGDKASSALTDAMSRVYDLLNSDMDMNPTITPVLDLSNVNRGMSNMRRLLDTEDMATSVSANMSTLGAVSGGYLGSSVANSNNTSNTFNITVDGAENPEAFADRLVQQIQLRTRMI